MKVQTAMKDTGQYIAVNWIYIRNALLWKAKYVRLNKARTTSNRNAWNVGSVGLRISVFIIMNWLQSAMISSTVEWWEMTHGLSDSAESNQLLPPDIIEWWNQNFAVFMRNRWTVDGSILLFTFSLLQRKVCKEGPCKAHLVVGNCLLYYANFLKMFTDFNLT
jgi:hypothetical protein